MLYVNHFVKISTVKIISVSVFCLLPFLPSFIFPSSPTGKKFRSKPQLSRYLGNTVDLACFDFRTGKMMPGKLQKNKQRYRHDPLSLAKVIVMDLHLLGRGCGCCMELIVGMHVLLILAFWRNTDICDVCLASFAVNFFLPCDWGKFLINSLSLCLN